MSILMLFTPTLLLFSGLSLSFAKEDSKNKSNPAPSKLQYSGENGSQPDNNSIYGSSDSFNPYGGFPISDGGFFGPQEILRNRFSGSDSNSQDQDQDQESGYPNQQGAGGSSSSYPSSRGEGNGVANGVFSNPFLGQRRRTSGIPSYGVTDSGSDPGYGGGSYPGGRFTPSYGSQQPSIYSSNSGPGFGQGFIYPSEQGYIYPIIGRGGSGIGLRQPNYNYPYGYGNGNGYGSYPGISRNIPSGFMPLSRGNGVYGERPSSGYGPSLFGYGQYPEMGYPGLGFEYGRLNESNPRRNGNLPPQGAELPYPPATPASVPSTEASNEKSNSLKKEDP